MLRVVCPFHCFPLRYLIQDGREWKPGAFVTGYDRIDVWESFCRDAKVLTDVPIDERFAADMVHVALAPFMLIAGALPLGRLVANRLQTSECDRGVVFT